MMNSTPVLSLPQIHQPQASGHIQVIFGLMFSGKTTELMRRMKQYQIANYRCLVIKYAKDTQYADEEIATHDRQILPAVTATALSEMNEMAEKFDIIGIDEGQFFPDIVQFCDEMAYQGKIVIVAALDGTFQRKGFGEILSLVPLAENIIKLSAVCMTCNLDGHFTKRTPLDKSIEGIDRADKYQAVCRNCFKLSLKNSPCHSPCKISSRHSLDKHALLKSGETPSVLWELQNLQNSAYRQLFISPMK